MSCKNQENILCRYCITLRDFTKVSSILTENARHENAVLRRENHKIRVENIKFREALKNRYCSTCSSTFMGDISISYEECLLRIENARLREELERISAENAKHAEKPLSFINSDEGKSSNHEDM